MSSDKKRENCCTPIKGWIKSVNSNVLKAQNDMGKDGLITSVGTRLNERIPADEFGYSLHYFNGDYNTQATAVAADNFIASTAGSGIPYKRKHSLLDTHPRSATARVLNILAATGEGGSGKPDASGMG